MLLVLVTMLIFGVLHSITAGQAKAWFRLRFGERAYHGLYRILYNVLSVILLVPVAWLIIFYDNRIVWQIDLAYELPLLALQMIGLIGVLVSLLQIDLWRFAGIRQAAVYFTAGALPLPDEPLQTGGVYALVRHPLYLFSLLVLWPVTTMTGAYLGFCIGATVYFVVGSWWEERRLLAAYGQPYADYQARVPWLFPFIKRRQV